MRMSRRMGLVASLGMHPESVTTSGGNLQYWTSASTTSDGWHNTNTNPSGEPFTNYEAYFGRNGSKVYHNAAVCFKTGKFTGKGKRVSVSVTVQQTAWADGIAYAAQLSRHDWSTAAEWAAGSKERYSNSMTTLPSDPKAIASKTGTVPKASGNQTLVLSFDAEILPETEYVIYIIGTSGTSGHLVTLLKTASYAPTITVTG